MSIDDVAADLQTIEDLRKRLQALAKVKNDLLAANKEQAKDVAALKTAIRELVNERDCLNMELRDLRGELDKLLK